MRDIRITWGLPTTRVEGGALDPQDIAGVDIYLSGDGGQNFSLLDRVVPTDPQELVQAQVSQGDYVARAIVEDTQGRRSNAEDVAFTVPDESEPGAVVNLVVELL